MKKLVKFSDRPCFFCGEPTTWGYNHEDKQYWSMGTAYELPDKKIGVLCLDCDRLKFRLEDYFDAFDSTIRKENPELFKQLVLFLRWLDENRFLNIQYAKKGRKSFYFAPWMNEQRKKGIHKDCLEAGGLNAEENE